MAAKDIKLNDNGDLLIKNGDFVIDFSDNQHIQDIINSHVGWWKEFPALGVGIRSFQSSSGQQQVLEQKIKLQLQSDGYNVNGIRCHQNPDGTFTIEATNITKKV